LIRRRQRDEVDRSRPAKYRLVRLGQARRSLISLILLEVGHLRLRLLPMILRDSCTCSRFWTRVQSNAWMLF